MLVASPSVFSTQRDDEPDLGAPAGSRSASSLPRRSLIRLTCRSARTPRRRRRRRPWFEQKAVIEKTDLPKATPTETDDPDRVWCRRTSSEKPKGRRRPKITTMPTPASTKSYRLRGDRCPDPRTSAGGNVFGCSLARNRRKRTSPEGNLAKRTCGTSETNSNAIRRIALSGTQR